MSNQSDDYPISGKLLVTFFKFVEKRFGEEDSALLENVLPVSSSTISKHKYYPREYPEKLNEYLGNKYGKEIFKELGRFTFQDLGKKRHIIRMAPVGMVLKKMGESFQDLDKHMKCNISDTKENYRIELIHPHINDNMKNIWAGTFEELLKTIKTKGHLKISEDKVKNEKMLIINIILK